MQNILKQIPLFSQLKGEELESLGQISRIKGYGAGEYAFHAGDASDILYILIEGTVKVFMIDAKGKEVILHYFNPITLVGEYANLNQKPFPAFALFDAPGKMLLVDFKQFKAEFLAHPDISLRLISSLVVKIKTLEDMLNRGLMLDSNARIIKLILEDEALFANLKHRQIASLLHLTPETLSRVLKKLKDLKLIEKTPEGGIKVLEKQKLQEFLDLNQ
jgi:CRP/FNR family transcriptional regulator